MRILPSGLQDHLDSGATTLCWCWKVVRRDGVELGFTDHDNDLTLDGLTFEATSGFVATDTRQAIGLNVDNSDIEGALQSGRITDIDLANGAYESARVELYRVNWATLDQRVLMRVATIGEVTREGYAFRAELRSSVHRLGQTQGRVFQRACDADLGDERCQVDVSLSTYSASGQVTDVISASQIVSSDVGDFAVGWFSFGLLRWIDGANAGRAVQIKSHSINGADHRFHLWESMSGTITSGDRFSVTAGCDKRLETCARTFGNAINFQGFPHAPGAHYVTFYPNSDDPR